MKKNTLLAVVVTVTIISAVRIAYTQDFLVKGQSSSIFKSWNTSTASSDKAAVVGLSTPVANWGYGGDFTGGYVGVRGASSLSGSGSRYGGYFTASNGTTNYGLYSAASTGTAWAGYFSGNVHSTGTITSASDSKLKTDVKDAAGTLQRVMELRPKEYRFRTAEFTQLHLPPGDQVGLIAQDVAQVFPELVENVVHPENPENKAAKGDQYLAVDYVRLVPILVKAIQEQQKQIDALRAQVAH